MKSSCSLGDPAVKIRVECAPVRALVPLGDPYSALCGEELMVSVEVHSFIGQHKLGYELQIVIQFTPPMGEG